MAATHARRDPTTTWCGRAATGVQLETPPSCGTCRRVAPPELLEDPDELDAALAAVGTDSIADRIAVKLLRDTLRHLESDDLPATARGMLTGRALQLLDALQLTPAARGQTPAKPEPDPDEQTPAGKLKLVRGRRA